MKRSWVFVFMLCCPVILNALMLGPSSQNLKRIKRDVCIVEENEKQMTTFNFTNLLNVADDYIIARNDTDGGSVYVQLCSSLKNKCNGQTGYSICLKKKNKEIGIGKSPPQVEFKSARITFRFIGDKCNSTSNYSTIIIMKCDYNASGNNSFPIIIPHAEDQCDIYLIWSTVYACGPRHRTSCSVADDSGHEYDLSPLTQYSENYEVPMNKSKIILNVCHSVIYGHGAACKQKAASCFQDSNANNSFIDIGEVEQPPYIDSADGILKIEYNNGDICTAVLGSVPHIKTVIFFICDPTGVNTSPSYMYGGEICAYHLEWKTSLACKEPLKDKTLISLTQTPVPMPTTPMTKSTPVIKSTTNSQIKCATENDEINLAGLIRSNNDYIVKTGDTEFRINVCNPLVYTENLTACRGGSACKIPNRGDTQGISLGKLEGRPVIDKNRNVVLQYKGGSPCVENQGESISSNVTFVCNYYGVDTGRPEFLKYTDCTYLFRWETRFVCGAVVGNYYNNCTISNPLSQTIDLSSLKKETFYKKNNQGKSYSISMCGGKNICNNSTICLDEKGYGSSVNVVYQYPKYSVKLNYTKGNKCSNGTLNSEIQLICNSTAGVGTPELTRASCRVTFGIHAPARQRRVGENFFFKNICPYLPIC
ncbi:cation-independent mannose-6-phosphate receptor isoform X2 [Belonocnema kinseyi]|uniref:cation-independent mannose-6-phosphate receptor isoform X2 n=1 Tax=Belonocnema kinseyi TaxID=2817044 RepID=UPI00143CEDA1|nr:cation-independent mannose-6-phosphate receptor isoform X2 [Belonocnema kinseyi]